MKLVVSCWNLMEDKTMTEESRNSKEEFLYPISNYYGEFTPEKMVFNANL